MIKIIKDITVFGEKILKGSEITIPLDLTNTGSGILICTVRDDKGQSASVPIIPVKYRTRIWAFLDELCRLNTGHNSYDEYNDYLRDLFYNNYKEYEKIALLPKIN